MYVKSFKYYLSIYENLPNLDKGVGLFFYPVLILFFFAGLFFFPILIIYNLYLKTQKSKNKIVEFVFSKNQLKISKQLNLKDSLFVNCITKDKLKSDSLIITDKKLLIVSLLNGLEVFNVLIKVSNDKRLRKNTLRLIKVIALSKIIRNLFKESKLLLQYNDHSPYNLMLHELAKKNGLKTMYIQHAPVSFKFPPLFHDFNILFSEDSLVKYKYTSGGVINNESVLKLFDFRIPKLGDLPTKLPKYILVCINKLDDLNMTKHALEKLIEHGFSVKLRPHPADERNFKFNEKILITKKGDSIWDDLSMAKAVIVNESAVPLESIYYDVPTYKLSSLNSDIHDNYNFLEHKLLLKDYKSIEELIIDLKENKIVWDKSKIYYFLGELDNRDSKITIFNNLLKTIIDN